MSARAIVILGRDGMGSHADEADFEAYVAYVCEHIDEECGFEVNVEPCHMRDVQETKILAYDVDDRDVREALAALWERFCLDENAWPEREVRP